MGNQLVVFDLAGEQFGVSISSEEQADLRMIDARN
jgi:hypothetical protein